MKEEEEETNGEEYENMRRRVGRGNVAAAEGYRPACTGLLTLL